MASAPTLQKALTLMTDLEEAQHVHPNHIMIPLNSETKSVLGKFPASLYSSPLIMEMQNQDYEGLDQTFMSKIAFCSGQQR